MDPAKRKGFDRWLLRRRARLAIPFVLISAAIIAVGTILWIDPLKDGRLISGTLVDRRSQQSEISSPTYWLVRLDDGRQVKVFHVAHLAFEKGRLVVLRERVGRLFGRREYNFHAFGGGEG